MYFKKLLFPETIISISYGHLTTFWWHVFVCCCDKHRKSVVCNPKYRGCRCLITY